MSDARGGAAGSDCDGDDSYDLPHSEKEAVPVAEAGAAAPARGGDAPPDDEPESDDSEGGGSPDRAEPNEDADEGGERAPVAEGGEEREGIVGVASVETNGEDAISHDGDDDEEEEDDGGEDEEDDDDDSTPDASPRAEMKVEGESSTGMAQSGASHRVEPDPFLDGDDSGSEEEQGAFMAELERFHREHSLEFKPPKFYGKGLNCLKLWRQVAHLGGHEQVTVCKLWRQVGETFRPPKTCTTVSWSFRIFYEKALLEYEKHKVRTGQLQIPPPALPQPGGTDREMVVNQSSSARVRRDAAARAMQGWHAHHLFANGTYGDHISKDKDTVPLSCRDKNLKSFGVLKRKKASSPEYTHKPSRTKVNKSQEDSMVLDVGEPADWVKINVRQTKDCFEVYALVPGLLREEVHVQSDPAGRLVITGDPEQPDNPWGITPFKKVVNLPSRIDPHQTSAVVTLHGQLFVRAPFGHADM
ncbi:AT-rich interactive domain-containing protein 5-like [Phragmites australis]|uniref:AT-rich interactive domain-containing protein 5-like n=1 Tax=Phragmites australis TaxID=29695 RepID=UPI002D7A1151|nr:AT-rich interactive domain-containing protein 5-like [Phragmites australis]